jgi:hypothetical protein
METEKMRKVISWVFIFCFISGVTTLACAQVNEQKPRNVILIGWDGAQRNHVKECLGRGELPHLKQLSSEGALVAIDILRVTDTKAGWAQILTGYEPEISGVYSNVRFGPIPKGYSIFERLEQFFGPDQFVTAALIAKKGNLGSEPERKELIPEPKSGGGKPAKKTGIPKGTETNRVIPAEPYFYTKDRIDIFANGLMKDEKVVLKTMELLARYKDQPFFFFIHFADVDHAGHQYGENSKEYNDALISTDHGTGQIIQKLKELNLYFQHVRLCDRGSWI